MRGHFRPPPTCRRHFLSVQDVLLTLQEKLALRGVDHFALALEPTATGEAGPAELLLLPEQETLARVRPRPPTP